MSYTRSILDSGIIRTMVHGRMDLQRSLASLTELSSMTKDRKLYEVVIHEPGSSLDVGFNEASRLVALAQKIFSGLEEGAIAFVADDDMIFALCRQLQMQISNEKVQLTVFRNESTALQWLRELMNSKSNIK